MEERELLRGWTAANVDALGDFINGCAFKPEDWVGKGTPIVRIQNLTDPSRPLNMTERVVEERYVIERGDLLVSWSATLDVFKWRGPRAYVNQHIFKVVPNPEVDKGFVFFALKESIRELLHSEHLHGTTMKHINRKPFLAHPVPLPPLNEQRNIVEKIETLFARLDKGEEALRDVQKLLARYRQSVLKAAVTGQLTADWRAENAHRLEHGRDLLARILKTRRETWDGRGRYKEPAAADTTELPDLPEGWVWASGNQLFSWSSGKFLPNKKQAGGDTPVYGGNGVNGFHDDYLVAKPTMVIGRVGAHCGNVHLTTGPAWVTDNAIYATLLPTECDLGFLTMLFRRAKLGESSKGGAQPFVNQEALNTTLVPLPPVVEQLEIMARLDADFSNSNAIEAACKTELTRSAALRQSILKDAFAGRLVPQDSADEPAAALLARIKENRAAASGKTRRKARA